MVAKCVCGNTVAKERANRQVSGNRAMGRYIFWQILVLCSTFWLNHSSWTYPFILPCSVVRFIGMAITFAQSLRHTCSRISIGGMVY